MGLSWSEAQDLVTAMATGITTARLSYRQRWALLIVLGLLGRSRRSRSTQEQELRATHAERKRLRKALDDMRQERDRERKRAEMAERDLKRSQKRGRPGCGKIPLGTSAEAQFYLELRCATTGEHHSDYMTYACTQGCEPVGSMAGVWHIGHVRRARKQGSVDYDTAADLLGLIDSNPRPQGDLA